MKETKKNTAALRYITLVYEDDPGKNVMVAGSFNGWKPEKQLTDKLLR